MRRQTASLLCVLLAAAVTVGTGRAVTAQGGAAPVYVDPLHKPLDTLLNEYVRDGLVYYGAVKQDRATLDRYIASLDGPSATAAAYAGWTRDQQLAFWLNAYNAFVLQTVINHYPIHGTSPLYPPHSIRQIPGAFDRITHRAAGRTVTLDQIEKQILPAFHDPRVYFALGRGAVGSGRLRSEAYASKRLDQQLDDVEAECLSRSSCAQIDEVGDVISVSSIFSWHAPEFIAGYAGKALPLFASRSPVERAILAYIRPDLLTIEKDFIARNTFRVTFQKFDWRLNDMNRRYR
ncbi:MAG TPA: DUF547 domain-containing protein [Vicinamibacterales bacterium]|nr:DUF547 domain-containing protein [Vicinamibacterales bacterium]